MENNNRKKILENNIRKYSYAFLKMYNIFKMR